MAFNCVLVTPDQQVLDESLSQAIIPASDGLLGILTGRSPLLAKLGIGPLRIDLASGQKKTYLIEGGIAQMKDNRLTVLTTAATLAEDISSEAARAEVDRLSAQHPTDKAQAAQLRVDLQRAKAKVAIAKR
jgi:F-type H+-transporting ATPase subunit epsilon